MNTALPSTMAERGVHDNLDKYSVHGIILTQGFSVVKR